MKRTVITVILVIGTVGAAIGVLAALGTRYDAESKAFADDAITKIAARWDAEELEKRASDELRAAAPIEQLREGCSQFNSILGALKRYKGAKGDSNMNLGIAGGTTVSAHYVAEATFEKGDAQIVLDLIHRDGTWKILGFHVNPANAQASAPPYKILGIGKVLFSQGAPALMLKYETRTSIDDKAALTREADQIWARFRFDVENSNLSNAVISANEAAESGGIVSSSRGYNFVYRKRADGRWERLGDGGVWSPVD